MAHKNLTSAFARIAGKSWLESEMVLSAVLNKDLASAEGAMYNPNPSAKEKTQASAIHPSGIPSTLKASTAYPSFRKATAKKLSLHFGQPIRKTPCQCVTIDILIVTCPVSQFFDSVCKGGT
jgi:hypothetical protein